MGGGIVSLKKKKKKKKKKKNYLVILGTWHVLNETLIQYKTMVSKTKYILRKETSEVGMWSEIKKKKKKTKKTPSFLSLMSNSKFVKENCFFF